MKADMPAVSGSDVPARPTSLAEDFPEGFDSSLGISAHALRTANGLMASAIGKREWDVPMIAAALESFAASPPLPKEQGPRFPWKDDAHRLIYDLFINDDQIIRSIAAQGLKHLLGITGPVPPPVADPRQAQMGETK